MVLSDYILYAKQQAFAVTSVYVDRMNMQYVKPYLYYDFNSSFTLSLFKYGSWHEEGHYWCKLRSP